MAACIAAVALFFAIRSSNASRKNATAAQKQLARLEESDRRKYAEHVDAWVSKVEPWRHVDPANPTNEYGDEIDKVYPNAWVVRLAVHNQDKEVIRNLGLEIVPAGKTGDSNTYLVGSIHRVPPSAKPIDYSFYVMFEELDASAAMRAELGMQFIDAKGNRWLRDHRGGLSDLDLAAATARFSAQFDRSMNLVDAVGIGKSEREYLFKEHRYNGDVS